MPCLQDFMTLTFLFTSPCLCLALCRACILTTSLKSHAQSRVCALPGVMPACAEGGFLLTVIWMTTHCPY